MSLLKLPQGFIHLVVIFIVLVTISISAPRVKMFSILPCPKISRESFLEGGNTIFCLCNFNPDCDRRIGRKLTSSERTASKEGEVHRREVLQLFHFCALVEESPEMVPEACPLFFPNGSTNRELKPLADWAENHSVWAHYYLFWE